MTKLLSRDDVMVLLGMGETIEILEKAFSDLAEGRAVMPQSTPITSPDHEGMAMFMPAYLKGVGALGSKIVTVFQYNQLKHDMAPVQGTIILLDERNGSTLAVMEAGHLTEMRTGGVAGLATKHMARRDAAVHTMLGTGSMARALAWAVDCVRPIERLLLHSVDPMEKRQVFVESLRDIIECEIVLTDDPVEAIGRADVVTLATDAKDPIVEADWFRPGTHINGVGSNSPASREIDGETVMRSKVVCDLIDACKTEAGDLIIPAETGDWSWEETRGDLGDVITGKLTGREDDDEITLFKSVGLAIQDISTAHHVYIKAMENGAGIDFQF